jgi:hypothetical protein
MTRYEEFMNKFAELLDEYNVELGVYEDRYGVAEFEIDFAIDNTTGERVVQSMHKRYVRGEQLRELVARYE